MIAPEILFQLVPRVDPEEDFPRDPASFEIDPDSPGRRIGVWSDYLRYRIHRDIQEDEFLNGLIQTSGFIGTGIFRVPNLPEARDHEGFPIISGHQFGAVLLRGIRHPEGTYIRGLPLDFGRYKAPIIQTVATFNPHAPQSRDGYVAAVFKDDDGMDCGITARHVVDGYRRGQRVPLECSDCGLPARLRKKAPGFIDAATVEFPCSGPGYKYGNNFPTVRPAVEGETVEAHFGDTGRKLCTVMQSLSSPAQIRCAAAPKHFLTDIHGHPGDSGSLVSMSHHRSGSTDLIGMYLGDTDCEDEHQNYVTYGYGVDLKQAADILGASNLLGDFNV